MKKVLELTLKELLVNKKNISVIFYLQLFMFFCSYNAVFSFLSPSAMAICYFCTMYMQEEEKCRGTNYLLTTSYTRQQVVFSRYFLHFLVFVAQTIIYFLLITIKNFSFPRFNFFTFSFCFLVTFTYLALFIPLSFFIKSKILAFISAIFFTSLLPITFLFDKLATTLTLSAPLLAVHCTSMLASAILLLILSIWLSSKIYYSLDL